MMQKDGCCCQVLENQSMVHEGGLGISKMCYAQENFSEVEIDKDAME
ncbi:hypothetical protein A2U01_0058658 [Trifolium medium]|uniref:Uncharacterized protein n=1 Tax=Trifolium medium TaxID=97028 RepID=A0A392RMX7_9FABA|nr:hypothetical protein [Trifolium medium]